MSVRPYRDQDYETVKALYLQGDLYGGQFDEARDSQKRLHDVTQRDPESILVYEIEEEIHGTISLIENGRVAWLFRFAVARVEDEKQIAQALHSEACRILQQRGHSQTLVYTPSTDLRLAERYNLLGMTEGSHYTCFWQDIGA